MPTFGESPFRSVRYADRSQLRLAWRVAAAVVVLVVVGIVGTAVVTVTTANARISGLPVDALARVQPDQPVNVLVATAVDADAPLDGVAVVQTDGSRPGAAVLVLPVALELDVPDAGPTVLADAPAVGGMALVVERVAAYTGLELHHYVRVDREPLAALVDDAGGLDDCPTPDADPCPRLIGDDVRRDLAPDPDAAVTGPQRVVAHLEVLDVVATEVSRPRTVWNPTRALFWADGWADVVTTDVEPSAGAARDLLDRLAGVDPAAVDVRVLPGLVDDGRLTALPETTAVLLDAFVRGVAPPPGVGVEAPEQLVPADVVVQVLNGVGRAGVAGDMAEFLAARGFEVAGTDNAPFFDPNARTTVGHLAGDEIVAELVASYLPGAELDEVRRVPAGVDVVVTVGAEEVP